MDSLAQTPQALGRALRDKRRQLGLTQAQLAELTGVGQPSLSSVERGVSNVSLTTLLRLLAALRLELVLQDREPRARRGPWEVA